MKRRPTKPATTPTTEPLPIGPHEPLPPEIQCWIDVEAWLITEADRYRSAVLPREMDLLGGMVDATRNLLTGLANKASAQARTAMKEHLARKSGTTQDGADDE